MRHALAIDIGGTKLAVGVVREDGVVIAQVREPTNAPEGPDATLPRLIALGRRVKAEAGVKLVGCGVGCPGPLDVRAGLVRSPPNLPAWVDVPVVEVPSRALGLIVVLENDANAAC